jgi:uncharacterized C2H2 Zn-finger protein
LPKGGMCMECGKTFTRYFNAVRHMESSHTAGPVNAECPVCQTVCKNRPALIKHLNRTHKMGTSVLKD